MRDLAHERSVARTRLYWRRREEPHEAGRLAQTQPWAAEPVNPIVAQGLLAVRVEDLARASGLMDHVAFTLYLEEAQEIHSSS